MPFEVIYKSYSYYYAMNCNRWKIHDIDECIHNVCIYIYIYLYIYIYIYIYCVRKCSFDIITVNFEAI